MRDSARGVSQDISAGIGGFASALHSWAQRETSNTPQNQRLIALLNDPRHELCSRAERQSFADDTHRIAGGEGEVICLQQFCVPEVHVESAGGGLHDHMRAERGDGRGCVVGNNGALKRGFAGKLISVISWRGWRFLLRVSDERQKQSGGEVAGATSAPKTLIH